MQSNPFQREAGSPTVSIYQHPNASQYIVRTLEEDVYFITLEDAQRFAARMLPLSQTMSAASIPVYTIPLFK
jgi:hypothetical protein